MAEHLGEKNDTGLGENSIKTPAEAAELYPAFYFAQNYKDQEGSHVAGTAYENRWYVPSIAELYKIYECCSDTTNGFDLNAVISLCGGDSFGTSCYWSSSQDASWYEEADYLDFENGRSYGSYKYNDWCNVCCIHWFN